MMDLLRNQVNLLEVLMGTESFCGLHFRDSLFLWSSGYADCCGVGSLCCCASAESE